MYERRISIGFGSRLTPVVKKLLIINGVVFLLQLFTMRVEPISPIIKYFALWPDRLFKDFYIWQPITYMFLHGNVFHILFNMFVLWMFGGDVERTLGRQRFLRLYLFSGIGAALLHILFNLGSPIHVIGASGAIYGIMVAFALLFPDRIITLLLFFVLPINLKAKHLVAIFIGISIVSGIQGEIFGVSDGIAHLAHLGGALTGFLFLRGSKLIGSIIFEYRKRHEWRKMAALHMKNEIRRQKQEEIDRILDRINEVGYDGITEKEKEILKKASDSLSKE